MNRNQLKQEVLNKTNGVCAYCGKPLTIQTMQINHIVPLYRGWTDDMLFSDGLVRGKDEMNNYLPSCASCNRKKGTDTIEQFRKNLADQTTRLLLRSAPVRQAIDFGMLIKPNVSPIIFEFEKQRMKEIRDMKIVLISDIKPSDDVYVYFEGDTELKTFYVSHKYPKPKRCINKVLFINRDDDGDRLSMDVPSLYTSESIYHGDERRAWICTNKYVAIEKMVEFWNKADLNYEKIW